MAEFRYTRPSFVSGKEHLDHIVDELNALYMTDGLPDSVQIKLGLVLNAAKEYREWAEKHDRSLVKQIREKDAELQSLVALNKRLKKKQYY